MQPTNLETDRIVRVKIPMDQALHALRILDECLVVDVSSLYVVIEADLVQRTALTCARVEHFMQT